MNLPYEKITPLDCTTHFEEKPSEEQLRSYTTSYLKNTALTEPDIDIKIDFLQLWQTPGYADIAAAERVSLCDTVHVYIDKLGIEVSCKVTETDYDVLLERYKTITLSNTKNYVERRGQIRISNDIDDRPDSTNRRERIGDWGADTMADAIGKACLVTLVDRRSRFLVGGKSALKKANQVNEVKISLFDILSWLKCITARKIMLAHPDLKKEVYKEKL